MKQNMQFLEITGSVTNLSPPKALSTKALEKLSVWGTDSYFLFVEVVGGVIEKSIMSDAKFNLDIPSKETVDVKASKLF